MLGYVTGLGRGEVDRLMREVADRLRAEGWPLAGAVQHNIETGPTSKCHMDLQVLSGADVVRISQDLGALSRGCRLDPQGLERVVGLVSAGLSKGAALLLVNKFGKQEVDGRGFRPVIGEALSSGVPVLVAVNEGNLEAFLTFAEDLAEALPPDVESVTDWCRARMREAAEV
ncbi:DUF2478 domain-containing protein [Salipiger sp. PrR002]|uniref:DUF2478 domain-containing protein n=1 Tax=Salipiger sp. PrR002 TaxID=2706489 RepID=UPI0013B6C759|nr:DUF2478 domain-containing protein [Salipiger sp. PrR002]NDW00919.1 DUF2478 domain-containing protein [Salipiger sp. PrR002]NDW56466.1 DUF2478 domain-containing protein [Salipiger sp. PrR004]